MRVFVTGASGFIGSAIVKDLLEQGHEVAGLARSDAAASKLQGLGARVVRGGIDDLQVLRQAAEQADGAIHTAFFHEISQIPLGKRLGVLLGGLPPGIVSRFTQATVDADRKALETMGQALRKRGGALVGTFATLALKPGRLATEEEKPDRSSVGGPRGATEAVMHALAAQGVRASIVRLPPIVHGPGDKGGFVPRLTAIARKKKNSAYVGDGRNRWAAVHRLDAARLFCLALENGTPGAIYHGVAEEGIPFRDLATQIGAGLQLPTVSVTATEAAKQFSFLSPFIPVDNPVSSALTQQLLGWKPTQPSLAEELRSGFHA